MIPQPFSPLARLARRTNDALINRGHSRGKVAYLHKLAEKLLRKALAPIHLCDFYQLDWSLFGYSLTSYSNRVSQIPLSN